MREQPPERFREAEAVLFDYGGTLDAKGVPWKERFLSLLVDEGCDIAPDRFDPAFYAADDALVGGIPETLSYADTVAQLAQGVVGALGLEDPALRERLGRRFLADSLSQVSANAGVLDALSRRYRLGIVSNFYGNLQTVCRDAGIDRYMTVMVDSSQIGCTKPDPAIFQAALQVLEVAPERAIFVGDSLRRDRAGAAATGIPFIWLRCERAETSGGDGGDHDFAVIDSLEQLREWLL